MTPLVIALATLAFLLPLCLVPPSLWHPYRAGSARRPDGAWASTLLVLCCAVAIVLLTVVGIAVTRWAPSVLQTSLLALGVGVLLGGLGLSLSGWETRGGQMYFLPDAWVGMALSAIVIARLGFGASRAWHAWLSWGGESVWLSVAALPGTFAAAMLLAGFGVTFWGGVRVRIARRQAATKMYADVSSFRTPRFEGAGGMTPIAD